MHTCMRASEPTLRGDGKSKRRRDTTSLRLLSNTQSAVLMCGVSAAVVGRELANRKAAGSATQASHLRNTGKTRPHGEG